MCIEISSKSASIEYEQSVAAACQTFQVFLDPVVDTFFEARETYYRPHIPQMAAQKKQKVCEERTFLFSSVLAGQTLRGIAVCAEGCAWSSTRLPQDVRYVKDTITFFEFSCPENPAFS